MVGSNCRVHITLDNTERGGQGRNIVLLNSPLERCVSEIKKLQLHNMPGCTHGDHPPGQYDLGRPHTKILIELCFSNCVGWYWGRKTGRAADLDYSRGEIEPSSTEELSLLLLPCSPREKEWAAPTSALCLWTHKAENKHGKKGCPTDVDLGNRENLLVTPLSPWRKTSGAGKRPKEQENTELLCCNEPRWEVTLGTLIQVAITGCSWITWQELWLWDPSSFVWTYPGDLAALQTSQPAKVRDQRMDKRDT